MRFESRTFWLSKDVDEPTQYQDAFALDAERGVAAIADGVSSAIFSGPWARLLAESVVASPPKLDDQGSFEGWLAAERQAWRSQIDTSRLTWYQRPKMVDGAMTTLAWIELLPVETADDGHATHYRVRGAAIGDSCLFHVHEGRSAGAFPMTASGQFGLNPAVIGSVSRNLDHMLAFHVYDEDCPVGDLLVLTTDAIALWAVERQEAGEPVDWQRYWDLSDDDWRAEIFALREDHRMRFDDSTLVLLRIIEERPAPPPSEPDEEPLLALPLEPTEMVVAEPDSVVSADAEETTEIIAADLELIDDEAPLAPTVETVELAQGETEDEVPPVSLVESKRREERMKDEG
jgi:hypothetical protein